MGAAAKLAKSAASSSRPVERFRLDGPSAPLDPLYDACRPDLADVALASTHFAPHYVQPVARIVTAGPLLGSPKKDAEILAALDEAEGFSLLDITGGWAWGYRTSDHLVGYVPVKRLKG